MRRCEGCPRTLAFDASPRKRFCRRCITQRSQLRWKRRVARMTPTEYMVYRVLHAARVKLTPSHRPIVTVKKCGMQDCSNTFEIKGPVGHNRRWCDRCRPLAYRISSDDAARRYRARQSILRTLGRAA